MLIRILPGLHAKTRKGKEAKQKPVHYSKFFVSLRAANNPERKQSGKEKLLSYCNHPN